MMIYNAKIINNKPCCPKCSSGDNLSGIRDYKEIVLGGNTYTMFQLKCYKCHADMRYLANIYVDKTIRYEVSGNIEEVRGD